MFYLDIIFYLSFFKNKNLKETYISILFDNII